MLLSCLHGSIVAPGPYIGDFSPELRQQEPAVILQKARASLASVSDFKKAADFLRGQIESLAKNTLDKITNIPDFNKLSEGEIALSKLDHQDTPKLLAVIKFLREAFSLQRFQQQTKTITPIEQMNFAKLLNQRIDPIDSDGIRGKTREAPKKFGPFQMTMSGLAVDILRVPTMLLDQSKNILSNLNAEFIKDFDIKAVAAKLFKELKLELDKFLIKMNRSLPQDQQKNDLMKKVILSIGGGLENAMSLHLAFVKVAFEKLKEKIPDKDSNDFKKYWANVLANLPHISKQFSTVQAFTLKLVENLNGVKSNQAEIYDFDPKNFELVSDNEDLILLPTLEFLQKVITQANDNSTMVHSTNEVRPGERSVNFAKEYFFPQGCPIHGAKGNLMVNNLNWMKVIFK